ncbi:MAG TPA: glycerol-3-phosphate 1-O-acyltransferase PlsY [Rhizomicrobium sp.]|jgi:glycerol-3-phosphate acyltransferase PlsY
MSDIGISMHFDILGIGLLIGYLLGSIPFGLIFTRMSGAGDIRQVGSGGTGATNVLRTGKYGAAAATLIFDAAKGAAAVLIARHFWNQDAAAVAALGAVLGHLFPVWLGFKGGKGVATSLGILLALYWPVALASLATWLVVAVVTRISSLSALVAAVAAPIYMFLWGEQEFAFATLIIALLVLIAHRDNIRRLLAGTEPRIGKSK